MKDFINLKGSSFILLLVILNSCEKGEIPTLITTEVTNISGSSATSGGTVINEGSGTVFERGICWSKSSKPTVEDNKRIEGGGAGTFVCNLSHLNGTTKYYVRAYATNKTGTAYGNEVIFQTAPENINFAEWIKYGNMTDQDGNSYKTVKIGLQIWMAENLRATHYQDGSPVPNVTNFNNWIMLNTGAYCFYENDILNRNAYGALYNWYAVGDPRKICPACWHVPADTEWTILENFLGGSNTAGMDIKEAGTSHWSSPNSGATNLSGFSALPAGSRYLTIKEDFLGIGFYCMWWSSSENNSNDESAWFRSLNVFKPGIERNYYWKIVGFSVRCIMD